MTKKIKKVEAKFGPKTNRALSIEPVANCDQFITLKHSTSAPHAFTVFGISMLPSVLNSQKAIDTSIRIIDAFVAMRSFMMQK